MQPSEGNSYSYHSYLCLLSARTCCNYYILYILQTCPPSCNTLVVYSYHDPSIHAIIHIQKNVQPIHEFHCHETQSLTSTDASIEADRICLSQCHSIPRSGWKSWDHLSNIAWSSILLCNYNWLLLVVNCETKWDWWRSWFMNWWA